MPDLKVPERYRAGIVAAVRIPDDAFQQLVAALAKAPRCQNSKELAKGISGDTPGLSPDDREKIVLTYASMLRVQQRSGYDIDTFAGDVISFFQQDAPSMIDGIDLGIMRERIANLLKYPSLELPSVKVTELMGEVERDFCDARILTDMRPVFSSNPEEPPAAIVLLHTLEIGFHDAERAQHRQFYVSLDEEDLQGLKAAIERAEKKANTLKSKFGSDNLRVY